MSESELSIDEANSQRRNYVVRYWKGDEPLWKAFWVNWILLGFVFSKTLDASENSENLSLMYISLVLFLAYLVWSVVGVWRCAPNTTNKYWGYVARFIVASGPVAGLILAIFS